jgi:hypothetical protein
MGDDRFATGGRRRDDNAPNEIREIRYIDREGVSWRAYERRRPDQRPALVFESRNTVRIVRDYPANWHTLPIAALIALSWCV